MSSFMYKSVIFSCDKGFSGYMSYLGIVCLIASLFLLLAYCMSSLRKPSLLKRTRGSETYEFGTTSVGNSSLILVNKHFYVLGVLFIVFDVELLYLFPWLYSYAGHCFNNKFLMFIFLVLLTAGFVYEIGAGALNWYNPAHNKLRPLASANQRKCGGLNKKTFATASHYWRKVRAVVLKISTVLRRYFLLALLKHLKFKNEMFSAILLGFAAVFYNFTILLQLIYCVIKLPIYLLPEFLLQVIFETLCLAITNVRCLIILAASPVIITGLGLAFIIGILILSKKKFSNREKVHINNFIILFLITLVFPNLYYSLQIDNLFISTLLLWYALVAILFLINSFYLTLGLIKKNSKVSLHFKITWFKNLSWNKGEANFFFKKMSLDDYLLMYPQLLRLKNLFKILNKYIISIDYSYVEYYLNYKFCYQILLFPIYLYFCVSCWLHGALTYNQRNIYNNYELPTLTCKNFKKSNWVIATVVLSIINVLLFFYILVDFNCFTCDFYRRGRYYLKNVSSHTGICCKVKWQTKIFRLNGYGTSYPREGFAIQMVNSKHWWVMNDHTNLNFCSDWYSKRILTNYEKKFIASISYALYQNAGKNNITSHLLIKGMVFYFNYLNR